MLDLKAFKAYFVVAMQQIVLYFLFILYNTTFTHVKLLKWTVLLYFALKNLAGDL